MRQLVKFQMFLERFLVNMMDDIQVCFVKEIDHIGIAVNDLESAIKLYVDLFRAILEIDNEVVDQGVRIAMLKFQSGTRLELMQPLNNEGTVARFLNKRGNALHHCCFAVENLEETLSKASNSNIDLIDHTPRQGVDGQIAFIHPKATGGILVELVQR